MAYDPADLKLPPWLLRFFDALVRIRIPIAPGWQLGVTRPGIMLTGVLLGLWAASFYSGNNLLYLCGAMLTSLAFVSIRQGMKLIRSVPPLADGLPESTQAGESYVMRRPLAAHSPYIGMIDIDWLAGSERITMQLRVEREMLLSGVLRATHRGLFRLERLELETTAPLGLWLLKRRRSEAAEWVVLPKAVPWPIAMFGESGSHQPFEGDDLRDLRSYVPGDAISRVHWRKAALDINDWSVKRFEQQEPEYETLRLRVDLRLPERTGQGEFERLLGQVWYWVESRQGKGGSEREVFLGQRLFRLHSEEERRALVRALATAEAERLPPAGQGGLLLSLVAQS